MIDPGTFPWLIVVAIHFAVIVRAILLDGRDSYSRAAWLLLLIALPVFGVILYILFGEPWISKGFRKRCRRIEEELRPFAPAPVGGDDAAGLTANAFRTFEAASRWPVSVGNTASLAPDSDTAIKMLVADIDSATTSVHLSFYIWLDDNNGTKVVEAICRAAGRGVTCRVAADAIGSRSLIRSAHWVAMQNAGAHLCSLLEAPLGLSFLVGHRTDLRNHRKIAVIDGRVAYGGSQNCADPAFLVKRRFAPWVDILIRFEGPVARQADLIFASAWTQGTGEDLRPVMGRNPPKPSTGGFPAIATGTGPLSPRGTMTEMFVSLLAAAQANVTITTPYFAPDPPLIGAIIAAARRGVAVRIIFPRRNDSRIVGAISRAYYPVLARAGVRIFEYCGGMLHAKTLVADEALVLIGSSNMDRRSLDLNFENSILLQSEKLAAQVLARQGDWLADAIEIDGDGADSRPIARRFTDNLLTIIAAVF
ncbi:cardiolipin synthase [Altericroceibacterium endophyticum]|uniref:Cardiolipin synthase n=1 Tax=Altericroceibacterium endophyticum TaxID=1808508 RepID=A0A6I4T994_9SPHN|nr:cardiolipin synthase [Altericroceibacterium endophyticum]MXO66721.1 cardiolipin synthase [Altericroceibacterium endophyticum]